MSSPDHGADPRLGTGGLTAAAGVAELFALLAATRGVEDFLADLATVAAQTLAVSCGLTMRYRDLPLTVASSDALATAVDEVQYGLDEGPCLQALATGQVVSAPDLLSEQRWDGYPAHALAHGVVSSLSLPLQVGEGTGGALNLYSTAPHAFTDPVTIERATAFAAQGSAVLTVALRQAEQTQLTEQLEQALSSRSVIDQAIGIIMGQQRCDAPTAFAVLRAASQSRNRKIRDIATDLVTSISGTPAAPGPLTEPG